MKLYSLYFVLSFAVAQDDYIDVGRLEDLKEVYYDESGQMHQVLAQPSSTLSSVDMAIIEETNREVLAIERDMCDLEEIGHLLAEYVVQDGEKLGVVEQQVESTEVQVVQTVEILKEAEKLQSQNLFLSLFLTGGVPASAGVGAGAAGFFATKAVVLAAAPTLAATAAPVVIPAALAVAAGGLTLAASNLVMRKFV